MWLMAVRFDGERRHVNHDFAGVFIYFQHVFPGDFYVAASARAEHQSAYPGISLLKNREDVVDYPQFFAAYAVHGPEMKQVGKEQEVLDFGHGALPETGFSSQK